MNDTPSALSGGGMPGGSGTYQFLALTNSGGFAGQNSIYQNTMQQQLQGQMHHRRPNYSNEDIVEDLNRCSALKLDYDDEEDNDENYQLEIMGESVTKNLEDRMHVIQEGGSRDEEGTHRSPDQQQQQQYIQQLVLNPYNDEKPDIEEVEDGVLETRKYLTGQNSEDRENFGSREINIEDQAHTERLGFASEQQRDEGLEETHDFPQVIQQIEVGGGENDSIIDNQFLDIPQNLRQQLYVACIIKEKEKRAESKISNQISSRSVSQPRSARNSSIGKSNSLQDKCHFSKTNIENESEVKQKLLNGFFTTQIPSGYLLKYNKNPGMTFDEATQLMHSQEYLFSFLQAFDTEKANIDVFGFDSCVNELQNHRLLNTNNDIVRFLSESTSFRLMSFKDSIHGAFGNSSGQLNELEFIANDFVFIFGQHNSNKSDILNVHKPESLMNRFIDTLADNIRHLKVSMFYQDQEFVIVSKMFNHSTLSGQKRELAMDLRQAQRTRMAIIKKHASMFRKVVSEQEKLCKEMRLSSHLVIQINNRIFVDLGGIESLNSLANPSIVQNLTLNFGSVTNQILKLSPFYANHDFNTSDFQEQSPFNIFLKTYLSPHSRVCLLCCVTSETKLTPQTMIALDYCHKIKCYFNGITEEDVKNRIIQDANNSDGLKQIRLREIGKLYEQFWLIRGGKEKSKGRNAISPRTGLNIDALREQALIRARMSDDPSGALAEEKRFVTILLKEIETYIATKPQKLSVTPIKTLNHNKSQGHLRMRTNSGSRSTTSLHAPQLVINHSHLQKGQKIMNMTVTENYKIKSQTRQIHKIPTVVQDLTRGRRSLSRQSKNSIGSGKARSPFSHHHKYSSKNSISSKLANGGNPSVLIHEQRQNFQIDPSIYEEYQSNKRKGNDTLLVDSRDTPQFQQDSICHQFNNSSLYIRTSAASSLKFNRRRPSAKRSDFNSIPAGAHQTCGGQSELYCETTDKKSTSRRRRAQVLSSGQKERKLSSSRARQSLLQESIRQLEDEQENSLQFSNPVSIAMHQMSGNERLTPKYLKAINESHIQEITRLREQLRQVEEQAERVKKASQRRVEELRTQIQERDKVIDSLEYQVESQKKQVQQLNRTVEQFRAERDEQTQQNGQIIKQIGQIKTLIEDCKEREREKEQLLLKIKQKDDKIKELQGRPEKSSRDMDFSKMRDEIKKLREENDKLNEQQATKIETMETKFQMIYSDYKRSLEENQKLQEDKKIQEEKVQQLEKAKENYKDQALELKAEVKQLRLQLNSRTACSTKIGDLAQNESSSILKDFENTQSIDEEMLIKQRDKQKEAVLGDIRNLISEYKKERKVNATQVRL